MVIRNIEYKDSESFLDMLKYVDEYYMAKIST